MQFTQEEMKHVTEAVEIIKDNFTLIKRAANKGSEHVRVDLLTALKYYKEAEDKLIDNKPDEITELEWKAIEAIYLLNEETGEDKSTLTEKTHMIFYEHLKKRMLKACGLTQKDVIFLQAVFDIFDSVCDFSDKEKKALYQEAKEKMLNNSIDSLTEEEKSLLHNVYMEGWTKTVRQSSTASKEVLELTKAYIVFFEDFNV